ncbi:MAG: histidine phosphatase family protein [Acidimicrobiia bacterium]|nr:histidine phosphatase family protein [Acidimicrobiia bacterium]
MLYLVRHGKAGSRHDWKGPDHERPLSKRGRRQAQGLVELVAGRDIDAVVSSPFVRCVETVQPLADKLGLEVEAASGLAEGASCDEALALVHRLASTTSVLCSHGDVIGIILDALAADGIDLPSDYPCAKGSTWEFQTTDGRIAGARYLPPPS